MEREKEKEKKAHQPCFPSLFLFLIDEGDDYNLRVCIVSVYCSSCEMDQLELYVLSAPGTEWDNVKFHQHFFIAFWIVKAAKQEGGWAANKRNKKALGELTKYGTMCIDLSTHTETETETLRDSGADTEI